MKLGPARRAETPSRARAVNQPLVLDSQLEVGTEVGFDSGPPCKKLCFTRETRILATRLSVSGIWVLLYRVDLGCRWAGETRTRAAGRDSEPSSSCESAARARFSA